MQKWMCHLRALVAVCAFEKSTGLCVLFLAWCHYSEHFTQCIFDLNCNTELTHLPGCAARLVMADSASQKSSAGTFLACGCWPGVERTRLVHHGRCCLGSDEPPRAPCQHGPTKLPGHLCCAWPSSESCTACAAPYMPPGDPRPVMLAVFEHS